MGAGSAETKLSRCRSAVTRPPLPGYPGTAPQNREPGRFSLNGSRRKLKAHDFLLPAGEENPKLTIFCSRQEKKIQSSQFSAPGRRRKSKAQCSIRKSISGEDSQIEIAKTHRVGDNVYLHDLIVSK